MARILVSGLTDGLVVKVYKIPFLIYLEQWLLEQGKKGV